MEVTSTLRILRAGAISFVLASLAIFFAYYIFPQQASILAITFVVIALTPLLYDATRDEEKIVEKCGVGFIERYSNIVESMLVISIGIFLAYLIWGALLPPGSPDGVCTGSLPCSSAIFLLQGEAAIATRGVFEALALVGFSFFLSLFLGAGALLIITWDLSSLIVRSAIGPLAFFAYLPQLFGFFLAGLAGALLSFAILSHDFKSPGFRHVISDSFLLLGLSIVLVILGAFFSGLTLT